MGDYWKKCVQIELNTEHKRKHVIFPISHTETYIPFQQNEKYKWSAWSCGFRKHFAHSAM